MINWQCPILNKAGYIFYYGEERTYHNFFLYADGLVHDLL